METKKGSSPLSLRRDYGVEDSEKNLLEEEPDEEMKKLYASCIKKAIKKAKQDADN